MWIPRATGQFQDVTDLAKHYKVLWLTIKIFMLFFTSTENMYVPEIQAIKALNESDHLS